MNPSIEADQRLRELALSVARNAVGPNNPIGSVLASEALTQAEYDRISPNPTYQKYLSAYTKDLTENGFSFAAKAQVLAEDLLPIAHALVKDPDVAGPARVKMMENLVEWAGLKPKQSVMATGGVGYSIVINIPSAGVEMTANQNMRHMGAADAIDVPVITIPSNPSPTLPSDVPGPAKTSTIRMEEPADYEYAGDDFTS